MNQLAQRAVLMRLSLGLPGQERQDKQLSADVKSEHSLGQNAGKWVKALYPPEALAKIKQLDGKAEKYHKTLTLPFDEGVGILPAGLITEYADKMRQFKGERDALIDDTFLSDPEKWVAWAHANHNGTFDAALYPGCTMNSSGNWTLDADVFRTEMRKRFYFRTEPVPVPDSAHFENNVKSLLGLDADSVNIRIEDAAKEAQAELLKRLMEPVQYMAETLSKEKPRIFETMVTKIEDIIGLAPKLNLAGDPAIDNFCREMQKLVRYNADTLRDSDRTRKEIGAEAKALMDKLAGYKMS